MSSYDSPIGRGVGNATGHNPDNPPPGSAIPWGQGGPAVRVTRDRVITPGETAYERLVPRYERAAPKTPNTDIQDNKRPVATYGHAERITKLEAQVEALMVGIKAMDRAIIALNDRCDGHIQRFREMEEGLQALKDSIGETDMDVEQLRTRIERLEHPAEPYEMFVITTKGGRRVRVTVQDA